MKHLLDKILNFGVSKKLTVFLIATYGLFSDTLTSEQWIKLALMYIGTQGVIDLWNKIKK